MKEKAESERPGSPQGIESPPWILCGLHRTRSLIAETPGIQKRGANIERAATWRDSTASEDRIDDAPASPPSATSIDRHPRELNGCAWDPSAWGTKDKGLGRSIPSGQKKSRACSSASPASGRVGQSVIARVPRLARFVLREH